MPRSYITLPSAAHSTSGGEIWLRCPACGEDSPFAALAAGAMVCGWCDFHFPLEAGPRLDLLVDGGSFQPLESGTAATAAEPGASPVRAGWATLHGRPLALAVGDASTSWSAADIQSLTALAKAARNEQRALLWVVTAAREAPATRPWSGLQVALHRRVEAGPPWVALLAGPCYGPVAALALQADLVLAEPGAVLAAALPAALREAGRLPTESTRPPGVLLRAGWADAVLSRAEQRAALKGLLDILEGGGAHQPAPARGAETALPAPLAPLFLSFREVHGDRQAEDDPALVGGLARLQQGGTPVVAIITVCGEGWADVQRRHAGAIGAAGWRKATRLLRLAGRFGLPVVLLVDRPALRTGRRDRPAEVAAALGETVQTLLSLPVPTLAVRLAAEESLPHLSLAAADCILVPDESVSLLRQSGAVVDATFTEQTLASLLAQHVHELNQTYTQHGALGRRALQQRRHVRWERG